MTRARVAAALAAILTALLLQATLVAPLAMLVPASLPAVLVAAVGLTEGPGTGISFGFAAGLVADLGSTHPAGVFALTWMGIGLVCGQIADRRSVRGDAATAAAVCAAGALVAGVLLTVLHADGASLWATVATAAPAGVADALLALAVVPATRAFLRNDVLRAPHPVVTELRVGGGRG